MANAAPSGSSQLSNRSPSRPPAELRPRPSTESGAAPESLQRSGTIPPDTSPSASSNASSSGDYEGPHPTPLRSGGRTNDNAVKPVQTVNARPLIAATMEGNIHEVELAAMFADYVPGTDPTEEQLDELHYDASVGEAGLESSKYPLIVSLFHPSTDRPVLRYSVVSDDRVDNRWGCTQRPDAT